MQKKGLRDEKENKVASSCFMRCLTFGIHNRSCIWPKRKAWLCKIFWQVELSYVTEMDLMHRPCALFMDSSGTQGNVRAQAAFLPNCPRGGNSEYPSTKHWGRSVQSNAGCSPKIYRFSGHQIPEGSSYLMCHHHYHHHHLYVCLPLSFSSSFRVFDLICHSVHLCSVTST